VLGFENPIEGVLAVLRSGSDGGFNFGWVVVIGAVFMR